MTNQTGAAEVVQQPSQPQSLQIDPDAFAAALQRAGLGGNGGQQQQQQMSEEDLNRMLNRFFVTQDLTQQLFDPNAPMETRMKALQMIVSGSVREAVTASTHLMRHHMDEFQSTLNPHLSVLSDMHRERVFNNFYSKYPTLKDHEEIVKMVGKEHGSAQVKSQEELFDLIAGKASEVIKKTNPAFDLKGQNTEQPSNSPTQPTGPRPASLSQGSQAGAANAPASNGGGKISDIWD